METPAAWEEEEEKALRVSDRSRVECDAMEVLWVGGNNSIIAASHERKRKLFYLSIGDGWGRPNGMNMKRGKLVTKKRMQIHKHTNKCCD